MKPCAHASYCPLRMRDGDRPGCNIASHRQGCEPTVEHVRGVFREFPFTPADVHTVFFQGRNKQLAKQ